MPDTVSNSGYPDIVIEVTDRNMKAYLEIRKPEEGTDLNISYQELIDIIASKGIAFGLNTDLVKEITDNKKWGEKFLIAEGLDPVPGENARLEFTFPIDKSYRPQITEDGHIDYHELSLVNSIQKDGILVTRIPPQLGSKGMNIMGQEIPPVLGEDIKIQTGPGTYKDPKESNIIRALQEGVIFYDSSKIYIEVQKMYQIKGSVDFSTGNINVKSSVEIQGDVKPGFSVKTPYNVQVNGSVEQATIICEGTLKVAKGVLGDHKQIIQSGADMHLGYVNNQIIKCKGKLYIQTEVRNSIIECCDEIMVMKNIGIILGGKIYVANKLTAAAIGNKYDVATEIEVGMNFQIKEKHDKKRDEILNLHKVIENVNKNISLISHSEQSEDNEIKLITLREESEAYMKQLDHLRKDLYEIEKEFYNVENPVVVVTNKVYPGVTIRLRHATYEVKEELTHIKFILENDQVVVKKL